MYLTIDAGSITGLPERESTLLARLLTVFNRHASKNAEKNKYYEGNISLREVNLGIALPEGVQKLEIGCAWGAKTVDVLAARSMFDGFVGLDGEDVGELDKICTDNDLTTEYMKACRDELKFGATYATLSADKTIGVRVRFHSAQTAAALWDGEKGRISAGLAIIDTKPSDAEEGTWEPSVINLYTDDCIWVLHRDGEQWSAEPHPHRMGRPLMEALIWNATSSKPFGRSRIKEPIRRLIQGYVRTIANATIGLEFATSPQKYLLGVTDEQYEKVINQKFRQYVGSILAATSNPETGQNPAFGQLVQGNITPHVEMVRILATQFSAASGLTVSDTGVVNDANPTSSDAILAQSQTLVTMAEQLNKGNGDSLRRIALMALAITKDVSLAELSDEEKAIVAHFKNPAMPNVAVTADAAIKIAATREHFSDTDTFLEMIGFDKADIRRIKNQESRSRARQFLNEVNEEIERRMG